MIKPVLRRSLVQQGRVLSFLHSLPDPVQLLRVHPFGHEGIHAYLPLIKAFHVDYLTRKLFRNMRLLKLQHTFSFVLFQLFYQQVGLQSLVCLFMVNFLCIKYYKIN